MLLTFLAYPPRAACDKLLYSQFSEAFSACFVLMFSEVHLRVDPQSEKSCTFDLRHLNVVDREDDICFADYWVHGHGEYVALCRVQSDV